MPCCTIDGHVANPNREARDMPKRYPVGLGIWLLARLAVHNHYNRHLRLGRQEPIWGIDLNHVDRLEVARITLELAHASKPAHLRSDVR